MSVYVNVATIIEDNEKEMKLTNGIKLKEKDILEKHVNSKVRVKWKIAYKKKSFQSGRAKSNG